MSKVMDGVIGHAIGDAMGTPVQFKDRKLFFGLFLCLRVSDLKIFVTSDSLGNNYKVDTLWQQCNKNITKLLQTTEKRDTIVPNL